MYSPVAVTSFLCVTFATSGFADPVPVQQLPQQPGDTVSAGFGTLLWSAMDDCFDESLEPVPVCLKTKAVIALDRALTKPTTAIIDDVALSTRASDSVHVTEPQPDEAADLAALDAAKDLDHKSDLLDEMLSHRMDMLVATKTIVMDEEGRGKKKDKTMQHAMIIAGIMTAGMLGPMLLKIIAIIAGKALMLSKIAILLSGILLLKKAMQSQQSHNEIEMIPAHLSLRRNSVIPDYQNEAYSAYKKHE